MGEQNFGEEGSFRDEMAGCYPMTEMVNERLRNLLAGKGIANPFAQIPGPINNPRKFTGYLAFPSNS